RVRAMVIGREASIGSKFAREQAVVERNAGDNTEIFLLCQRQDFGHHLLAQGIERKLNGVSSAALKNRQGFFRQKNAHAKPADLALFHQPLHGFRPIALADIVPDGIVQLVEIDHIFLQALQALLARPGDVLARPIFHADAVAHHVAAFAGDERVSPITGESFADELLAAAVAVNIGGVEEVDAQFAGTTQGGDGVVFRRLTPAPLYASRFAGTTDGPGAEADLANFGAGSAEYAVVHVRVSRFWFLVSRSLALTPLGGPRTGAPRLHSGQAKHAPR